MVTDAMRAAASSPASASLWKRTLASARGANAAPAITSHSGGLVPDGSGTSPGHTQPPRRRLRPPPGPWSTAPAPPRRPRRGGRTPINRSTAALSLKKRAWLHCPKSLRGVRPDGGGPGQRLRAAEVRHEALDGGGDLDDALGVGRPAEVLQPGQQIGQLQQGEGRGELGILDIAADPRSSASWAIASAQAARRRLPLRVVQGRRAARGPGPGSGGDSRTAASRRGRRR